MIQKGFIEIKNASVLSGLMNHKFHPKLTEIMAWMADQYGIVMTESYRAPLHPGDVHSTDPVRAIDIKSRCYESVHASQIRDKINNKWQYDPDRPHMQCAIIHDVGNGIHFHIQVHPMTIKRG